MSSKHYVSLMMWIFYINWQQYWKCDWTMNIGVNQNAQNDKMTKEQYKQNRHKWQTWQLGFQTLERYWTKLITGMERVFFCVCVCVFSSNALTIWCCILISRPLWVFRHFKRRSYLYFIWGIHIHWGKTLHASKNQHRSSLNMHILTQLLIFCIYFIPGIVEALNKLI